MTKSNQTSIKLPSEKEKTDAIAEKARKLTAGFNAESGADNTLTKAEVVKMTPRTRMEFFMNGGKLNHA
jgi:hypothetical protein